MLDFIFQNLDIILIAIFFIFLFWNILLELRLAKERRRTTFFFKSEKAKDLEEVIFKILKVQEETRKEIREILERLERLDKIALHSIQKVGMVRFNPFGDIGGDQSFSLAVLDGQDNGIVISSYHSKERTRTYAKPIENGKSKYPLSEEEEKAIKEAKSY